MYRLYEEKAEEEGITNTVKEHIYTHYNFAFHKPKKDECNLWNKYKSGVRKNLKCIKRIRRKYESKKKLIRMLLQLKSYMLAALTWSKCSMYCIVLWGSSFIHENSTYTTALYTVSVTKMGHALCGVKQRQKRGSCEVATCMLKYLKSLPKSIKCVQRYLRWTKPK